jgi:hypothetical protein
MTKFYIDKLGKHLVDFSNYEVDPDGWIYEIPANRQNGIITSKPVGNISDFIELDKKVSDFKIGDDIYVLKEDNVLIGKLIEPIVNTSDVNSDGTKLLLKTSYTLKSTTSDGIIDIDSDSPAALQN